MDKNDRINELLSERRMDDPDDRKSNYVKGLYDLVKDYVNENTVMAEIGCYRGVSTELFALHCKKIFAIDPWDLVLEGKYVNVSRATAKLPRQLEAQRVFNERVSSYNNVETIRGWSYDSDIYNKFEDNSLDMIYIDGHHTFDAGLEDVRNWFPKLKVGGVLAGHDYYLIEIKKLVDAVTEQIPERKRYSDGSWAFIKPNREISI